MARRRFTQDEEEQDFEERAPKPYEYVPLPTGELLKDSPLRYEGHSLEHGGLMSGQLQGLIVALTPIHVASGRIEMMAEIDPAQARETPLVRDFFRSGGQRVIPASSLKGAIRAIVEAITYSCVNKMARGTILPKQLIECRFDQARGHTELCTACRLFGAMGYMGQVSFGDAVQFEGGNQVIRIPPMHSSQRQRRGRRFYLHGRPATGGNVPVEVCPAGSRFRFDMRFENLTRGELGVLLIAMGQGEPPINPKLGGGKPACLGSVRVEIESLTVRHPLRDFLTYDLPPSGGSVEMSRYINTAYRARRLLFREGLEALVEVLRYDEDEERECPEGNY
jgi:CRISPR/Cas system CSM-associated protein Csm3 (group 7 of RAMP superfamily)